jgi:hypothetical protein
MKVVVGRPGEETPLLAARIRHLSLNPYWNVPADLVRKIIAPAVLKQGPGYLRSAGYEVLTDWSRARARGTLARSTGQPWSTAVSICRSGSSRDRAIRWGK